MGSGSLGLVQRHEPTGDNELELCALRPASVASRPTGTPAQPDRSGWQGALDRPIGWQPVAASLPAPAGYRVCGSAACSAQTSASGVGASRPMCLSLTLGARRAPTLEGLSDSSAVLIQRLKWSSTEPYSTATPNLLSALILALGKEWADEWILCQRLDRME